MRIGFESVGLYRFSMERALSKLTKEDKGGGGDGGPGTVAQAPQWHEVQPSGHHPCGRRRRNCLLGRHTPALGLWTARRRTSLLWDGQGVSCWLGTASPRPPATVPTSPPVRKRGVLRCRRWVRRKRRLHLFDMVRGTRPRRWKTRARSGKEEEEGEKWEGGGGGTQPACGAASPRQCSGKGL